MKKEKIIAEFREKFEYWSGIRMFCQNELTTNEVKVLDLRNCKFTLEEVGKFMGVTRERIRQIEAKANAKVEMKQYFIDWLSEKLDEYESTYF